MGFLISHEPVVAIYHFHMEMELMEKYPFTFSQAWRGKKVTWLLIPYSFPAILMIMES